MRAGRERVTDRLAWRGRRCRRGDPLAGGRLSVVRGFAALPARARPGQRGPAGGPAVPRQPRRRPTSTPTTRSRALMAAAAPRPPRTRRDLPDPDRPAGGHRPAGRGSHPPGPRRRRPRTTGCSPSATASSASPARCRCTPHDRGAARYLARRDRRPSRPARPAHRWRCLTSTTGTGCCATTCISVFARLVRDAGLRRARRPSPAAAA